MHTALPPVVAPSGAPPAFGNFYVLFWSLLNILVLVAVIILIIWFINYLKRQNSYKKQFLSKIDRLIEVLEQKNIDK
jgi:uncharacterized membrane protein